MTDKDELLKYIHCLWQQFQIDSDQYRELINMVNKLTNKENTNNA